MRIMKAIAKTIAAGVTAVGILCGIFAVYSVIPVHEENKDGNTDYVWAANSVWVKMTEGFSFGRYDAKGYNNLEVIENPDILVLGSSHMEANNVMQDQNLTYLLNEALEGRYKVYNQGISGHHFTKVCKYLPVTLRMYENPPKAVVIETDRTYFSTEDVDRLLQGTVDFTPSNATGLIAQLQKLPFARVAYHQLSGGLLNLFMPEQKAAKKTVAPVQQNANEEDYDRLFGYIREATEGYDTEIIIFYHAPGTLQKDGTIIYESTAETALFARKCEENGITFIDMKTSFNQMYYEQNKVPYGFSTGKLGSGHLNADGHAQIAKEVIKTIQALEEAGRLCK